MGKNVKVKSGTTWEELVGYSRAVRVGNQIFISGTTAVDENNKIVAPGNPYLQSRFILKKIANTLEKTGASIKHVCRTRIFVVDISMWEDVGRAHGEFFKEIRPASTMVQVSSLIEPDLLVEIEVDAVIPNES
ncbi:MAG: hypothetical protein SCALA702_18480 [Melioribacteraceae bacterium]|nr:MAG: hypothetical protein SCALA702_18480 [Melioribacteraceae bacterium]